MGFYLNKNFKMFTNISRRCISQNLTKWSRNETKVRGLKSLSLRQTIGIPAKTSSFVPIKTFGYGQQKLIHTSQTMNTVATSFHVQDEEDFKERVLASSTPVVVDFHAEWRGPCKLLGPRIEQAVSLLDGKILLAKVDIDDMPELAMKYKIVAVPSVLLFKKGSELDRFTGNIDDDLLQRFVQKQ